MDYIVKDYHALTHAQKRIWYLEKVFKGLSYENISFTVSFNEQPDVLLIEKAINLIIEKNDGMRIRIVETENGECRQYFSDYRFIEIEKVYFKGDNAEEKAEKFLNYQASIPLNINNSDLFYFAIVNVNHDVRVFMKTHHIISDGWTMGIITNQIVEYYKWLREGNENINCSRGSYFHYILWEEKYKESERFNEHAKFWHKRFDTIPEELSIEPYKKWDKEDLSSDRKVYILSADLTSEIMEFCKSNRTSVFRIFLASLFIYVFRVTSREDISIAAPIHNRFEEWQKDIIGMFVSTTVFRLIMRGDISFQCLLESLSDELKSVITNQSYPYDQLVYDLRKKYHCQNDISLYDILLSYQNAVYCEDIRDVNWNFCGQVPNSIAFHVSDRGLKGCLKIEIDYRTSLFTPSEIERIYGCLINIIKHGMNDPTQKVSLLEIQSEDEKRKLLADFNATNMNFPEDKTIHQLFEEQTEKTPDNIAAVFKDKLITYAQLNNNINRLATRLRLIGVKPNDVVGLMIERSIDMLIGIMAILKAGGGYLPIDPKYPLDRIKFMIADSGMNVLLTKRNLYKDFSFCKEVVYADDYESFPEVGHNIDNVNKTDDLAYIIYTSGSTGKPKGVMIEHRAVNNFITGMKERIDFNSEKTILALTTISFDIFVLENILPLTTGMKIIIADEEEQVDPARLNSLVIEKTVDMLQTTPSRMELIISDEKSRLSLKNIKEIMVGGEPVTDILLKSLKALTAAKIYNMYGPTETTVWSALKELTDSDTITIGSPIANTRIYIVNNNLQMLPLGVAGELCIAGSGLARGYHNCQELTAQRFVTNPFKDEKCKEHDNGLMYRTGDLARWLPNGEIEFIGRTDNQVKVRGYRIELEEVEKVLVQLDEIDRCTVIVRENPEGNKELIAYYVSITEIPFSKLNSFLLEKLPYYMVPGAFIHMSALPLTPNGKLDKKQLPDPSTCLCSSRKEDYSAPETEHQKNLADIWSKVLNRSTIGLNDTFFEIGGNSFSLVMMHSQIDKLYPGKVSIADIFANPTISKLSDFISNQLVNENKTMNTSLVKLPEKYFLDADDDAEEDTLIINLDTELCDKVFRICRKYNIDVSEFALGIYLYLLIEAAMHKNVSVQVLSGNDYLVRQISPDFDKISSMEDLLMQVKLACSLSSNNSTCSLQKVIQTGVEKDKTEILPIFINNVQINSRLTEVYDIILKLNSKMKKISFHFNFNTRRIRYKAMKALVLSYLQLIKEIVNN